MSRAKNLPARVLCARGGLFSLSTLPVLPPQCSLLVGSWEERGSALLLTAPGRHSHECHYLMPPMALRAGCPGSDTMLGSEQGWVLAFSVSIWTVVMVLKWNQASWT